MGEEEQFCIRDPVVEILDLRGLRMSSPPFTPIDDKWESLAFSHPLAGKCDLRSA
jgi:hypothetical protein